MALQISSVQNPKVREAARLDKRSERDERRVTRVEGVREVSRALESGVIPVEAFFCRDLLLGSDAAAAVARLETLDRDRRTRLYEVTPEVFARLAVREESGGIVLVVPYLPGDLSRLTISPNPFLCVVEGVEKPGNLGAILRSADGAGVDAVVVTDPNTDLHNPNVIRASLGAFFTVPICEAPAGETLDFLRSHNVRVVAAHPDAELLYTAADLRGPIALVLGSEAAGLSAQWRSEAHLLVRIPMLGRIDSLNLATATALLLYEALRQRSL